MIKVCQKCGMLLNEPFEIDKEYECPFCSHISNDYLEVPEDELKDSLSELLSLAISLASKHHKFQYDKAGVPYILHPLAVMNKINEEDYYLNLICKIVAVLHDIIEDTPVTIGMLLHEGFPIFIVKAVDLLTKKEGQSKNKYYKELKKNPISKIVKLADLEHNIDISRIKNPTEKDFKRVEIYKERYKELTKE